MASYTDQPISFSPYVSQLPIVEEMSKVGMEKQAQYNQGIQRIQGQIDNVAGLDVIRDVDKQHLQSKLNELGSRLKTVAAGDFSNFQLVNSVGGMANQIIKDPNVINAVTSTGRFRQQQQLMDQAKKEGKSSINREYDFNKGVSEWMNGDINHSYNGQFVQHTDVNKKILGIIEKLHPNSNVHDIVNATNPDGSVNYGVIADAMHRSGEKGVSEGQIRTAVNSMLDPNDMDELASQGRYTYKDHSPQDLQNATTESYLATKSNYLRRLDELNKRVDTVSDPSQKMEISNEISYYRAQLGDPYENIPGKLDQSYAMTLKTIQESPDAARSSLYTKNYLDQVGNGFAYREVTDELHENPIKKEYWNKVNFELKRDVDYKNLALRGKEVEISGEHLHIAQDKEARESIEFAQKQEDRLGTGKHYFNREGDPTTQKNEALVNFANDNQERASFNSKILADRAKSMSTSDKKYTSKDIEGLIKRYQSLGGDHYQPQTNAEKRDFDAYITNDRAMSSAQKVLEQKREEAYKELSGGLNEKQLLESELNKHKPLKVTQDGVDYVFTPKEMYDFLNKEHEQLSSGVVTAGGTGIVSKILPGENLTSKELALSKALSSRYSASGQPLGGNEGLNEELNDYKNLANKHKEFDSKVTALLAEKMAPITGTFASEQAAITFKNKEEEENFKNEISSIINTDINKKVGTVNYNTSEAMTKLTKAGGTDVDQAFVRRGNQYFIKLYSKANPTKDSQLIPINQDAVRNIKGLGKGLLNEDLDFAQALLMNNNTTNESGDYATAYYHNGLFGGVDVYNNRTVTYPIAADIRHDGGEYYATIRVLKKDSTTFSLPPLPATSQSNFKQWLSTLDNEQIRNLFKVKGYDIDQIIK